MLVFSAADFEDFLEPRPDLSENVEAELEQVIRVLAANRWPFRLHATYDESISHFLNVYERVNRDIPFSGLHWFFDHAETVGDKNLERIAALNGGIAIQHRMAFQGEYFVERYGAEAALRTPPVRKMLEMGLPVGAGTDATRVASYNPFVSLYWLVSGKTIGGLEIYDDHGRLSRQEALHLYTQGSSWFSGEDGTKGGLFVGQLADFAVLTGDYFNIPEEDIRNLQSALTVVDGEVVYASEDFVNYAPPALPLALDWAPTVHHGGYYNPHSASGKAVVACVAHSHAGTSASHLGQAVWGLGCDCFAF